MINFDEDFLKAPAQRIDVLRARLSEPALELLAREVVHRLSTRGHRDIGGQDPAHPSTDDIEILCTALISSDPAISGGMMQRLQTRGLTLEVLYGKYLAAAAARLGEMWEEDQLSFVAVTIGAGRIFEIVRLLRQALPPPRITRAEPVLFVSVPGERHAVGVEMASELFRQQGWDVQMLLGADHDQIMTEIARAGCAVLGLSSGGGRTIEALTRLIYAVRVAHPEIHIMVSGQVVNTDPELVQVMEPDTAVATVEDALASMEALTARVEAAIQNVRSRR